MKKSTLTAAEVKLIKKFADQRSEVGRRFPLLSGMLATLAFAMMLGGFSEMIKDVEFLSNNPWIMFGGGFLLLLLTGTVYKKLN